MPSGGAPPFTRSGMALVELLEDADLQQNGGSPGYMSIGQGDILQSGAGKTSFYDVAIAGAPTWTPGPGAAGAWRTQDNAIGLSSRVCGIVGVPVRQSLALSGLPLATLRQKRYTYEAAVMRDSIGANGAFEIGLMSSAPLIGRAGDVGTGIHLVSYDGRFAGRWHVAGRFVGGGPLTLSADSGVSPLAWAHVRFRYVTGPVRALTVELNGVLLYTFADADLPTIPDPNGNYIGLRPGWASGHTGAGTFSAIAQSRYAVELLG